MTPPPPRRRLPFPCQRAHGGRIPSAARAAGVSGRASGTRASLAAPASRRPTGPCDPACVTGRWAEMLGPEEPREPGQTVRRRASRPAEPGDQEMLGAVRPARPSQSMPRPGAAPASTVASNLTTGVDWLPRPRQACSPPPLLWLRIVRTNVPVHPAVCESDGDSAAGVMRKQPAIPAYWYMATTTYWMQVLSISHTVGSKWE